MGPLASTYVLRAVPFYPTAPPPNPRTGLATYRHGDCYWHAAAPEASSAGDKIQQAWPAVTSGDRPPSVDDFSRTLKSMQHSQENLKLQYLQHHLSHLQRNPVF